MVKPLKSGRTWVKFEKLTIRLLSGTADKSFAFSDLLKIALNAGFDLRINGSHHILTKTGIPEIINLQPKGKQAKPYQVKQVRELIIKFKLYSELQNNIEDAEQ